MKKGRLLDFMQAGAKAIFLIFGGPVLLFVALVLVCFLGPKAGMDSMMEMT